MDEVAFELGEALEDGLQPDEGDGKGFAPSPISYDSALLAVETAKGDCLITPIAPFDRTEIVVEDT